MFSVPKGHGTLLLNFSQGWRLLKTVVLITATALAVSSSFVSAEGGNGANSDQPLPKIIGGVPAAAGAYPWMVAILQRNTAEGGDLFNAQFCGGTLIADRWVLSAAHCYANNQGEQMTQPGELLVMIGEIVLDPGPMLHAVNQIIIHQDFNTDNNSFTNDIALLRLSDPVPDPTLPYNQLNDSPLAMPGVTAKIIGWGSLMWDDAAGRPFDFPKNLHQADVPLISNQECAAALSDVNPPIDINENHLCAGILTQGGVDTCAADSGGPIFVSDGQGGFLQVGITSFGVGCGLPNRPGVYTRVSRYADWIMEMIGGAVVVPHWGNGQGLATDLIVYNASASEASDTEIIFRDRDGNELSTAALLADTSGFTPQGVMLDGNRLQLPPLGTHTLSTNGVGVAVSGSISLLSTAGSVGAAIRFRLTGIGIAGVGTAEPDDSLIAPARREGRLNTGVAIHNPGSEAIVVDLTLKDPAGQVVPNGQAELNLPPRGQVASFIHQLFPLADTQPFVGTICITARSGRVAAVALELGAQPGEFTTLPVSSIR